jgi:hypothetical protein
MTPLENDAFIVCHDYSLIKQLENSEQFNTLPNYKYLLVGQSKNISSEYSDKIIVCENLPHNIESLPNLLTFTAWYAISKNNLSKTKWVTIFEYDVKIKNGIDCELDDFDAIGYIEYLIDNEKSFRDYPPYISEYVKKFNLTDHEKKIYNLYGSEKWACTTNFTLKNTFLDEFVDYYYKLILEENIYNKIKQAHIHERMITLFCLINHNKIKLEEGYLEHFGRLSHGI